MNTLTFKTSTGYEVYYLSEVTYKVKKAIKRELYRGFTTTKEGKSVFDAGCLVTANEEAMKHLVTKIVKPDASVVVGPDAIIECIDSFSPEDGDALAEAIDQIAKVEDELGKKKEIPTS